MMKIFQLVALLLLLNACTTAYKTDDYARGISTTQLESNQFRVSYKGSTTSGDEKSTDLTLLRSAEIALENGFNYFVIVETDESASHGTNSADNTTGQNEIDTDNASHEPTTYGDQTYIHSNPGAINTIVCFKEKPQGFAYISLFLKATLRGKYNLDKPVE